MIDDDNLDSSYKRARAAGALDRPFDAIVIGSGAGGMTAAALLACEGRRVLVLERHATAGGCTQVFKRNGYEWDAGLHYMGEVHREQSGLRRLFDRVTGGRLQWAPMPEVYNRIYIGEREYEYVAGTERFKERMKSYFPREAEAIDRYVELISGANRAAKAFFAERALPDAAASAGAGASSGEEFMHYASQTAMQVLTRLTDDAELIAVLCGHYGDYSLLPDEASFAVHAMLIKHYIEGASYPVGGAGRIPETMTRTIEAAGGRVLVAAEVAQVLVRGGRSHGVVMADGTELEAPVVISGAGIAQTLRLLPAGTPGTEAVNARASALRPSLCYVMLNIGLRASNSELKMDPANLWAHPGNDLRANWERYAADPVHQSMPLHFLTQPSAKDPSWLDRYPGRSTIDICSLTDWKLFEPYATTQWMRRGEDYEALKERITEEMLDVVYRFHPQVRGKVDHVELATPLSFNHFLGRSYGDFMSFAQTPERFEQRWMRAHSPVRGLYFSGQDITGAGVSGAMVGGLVAASAVVGRDLFQTLRG
jgi:all-trans-retinol 13,14-reductase